MKPISLVSSEPPQWSNFWPKEVLEGLPVFFRPGQYSQIVIHKTNQPDAVVNSLDTDGLTGEGCTEVDLPVAQGKDCPRSW